MASTYEKIATTTLGSTQATVTFSSISGSYTDLVLIISAKSSGATNNSIFMRFNSDTGSNYSYTRLFGNGSSAVSNRYSNQTVIDIGYPGGSNTSSVFAPSIVNIQNYSNATTYKSTLLRWGSQGTSDQYVMSEVGLWRNTAAITSITLTLDANSFATGSTFTLYGILKA